MWLPEGLENTPFRLVLEFVGLIDAKVIDMGQTIWP